MEKEILNENIIKWFDKKVSELFFEVHKMVKSIPIAELVCNKLLYSLEYVKEFNKAINKEVVFTIYWSCINEYLKENVKWKNGKLIFSNGIAIDMNDLNNFINVNFKLLPLNYNCKIFKKINASNTVEEDNEYHDKLKYRLNNSNFKLHLLLDSSKIDTIILLLFDFLRLKRNKLLIMHDEKIVIIEDCMFMLEFINFLFLKKIELSFDYKKLFSKEYKIKSNNFLPLVCQLIDKVTIPSRIYSNAFYYKYVVEYSTFENGKFMKKKAIIRVNQNVFEEYNIGNFLEIEFDISVSGGHNEISANKISIANIKEAKNKFLPLSCKLIDKKIEPDLIIPGVYYYKYLIEYSCNFNKKTAIIDIDKKYFDLYERGNIIEVEYNLNYVEPKNKSNFFGLNKIYAKKISHVIIGPNYKVLTLT